MKWLWIFLFLAFWAGFFEFQRKSDDLKKRLEAVSDTLLSIRSQQEIFMKRVAARPFSAMADMDKSAIVEWHRIRYSTDNGLFIVVIEVDSTGEVRSIFGKAKIKRPLPDDLAKIQFDIDSVKMNISFEEIRAFEKELSDLKFDSISIDRRDWFCCFGGGTMDWSSGKKGQPNHYFNTWCHAAKPFAQACEKILLLSGDGDVRKSIEWMRQ